MAGGGGNPATGNSSAGGGGGGAAGYDNTGASGGGGLGGQGRAQHASTSSNQNRMKNGLAGRGGGVELHGKGTTGGTGARSPYLITYSYPEYDYTGASNGGVGSDSNSATVSVGGGGGGGNGGRIRYQDLNASNNNPPSYYKWFVVAQGPDNAQDGGVRIQWGASDYP